jgi:hypothetical protein
MQFGDSMARIGGKWVNAVKPWFQRLKRLFADKAISEVRLEPGELGPLEGRGSWSPTGGSMMSLRIT